MRKKYCDFVKRRYVNGAAVALLDVLIANTALLIAFLMRFDFKWSAIPTEYVSDWPMFAVVFTAVTLLIYVMFGLYNFVWSFIGISDAITIIAANATVAAMTYITALLLGYQIPLSIFCITVILQLTGSLAVRFSVRCARRLFGKVHKRSGAEPERLMIVGAGAAGTALIRELKETDKYNAEVVCIIDDNKGKKGRRIANVPIVGGRDSIISEAARSHIDTIIFAIPSISPIEKKRILTICNMTDCRLKAVPAIYQMVNGEVTFNKLKNVEIEDLLGREPIRLDMEKANSYLKGRTVLVTGGGGSIGSELCRQIASCGPKKLIIFDIYENNAYDIQQELLYENSRLDLTVLIGSVRDEKRLDRVFDIYRPEIVFHAAAHKHVPLMESNPCEAVKNNVLGTYNTACMADRYGAEKFVLISTDKAVNPTSVMGATKRVCEMIIQSFDRKSETDFVAVRFGNVLGSNGSVIPLFKKQIASGGPVTVTDRRIVRYFMTIREAVSLVIQAGALATGGEIFILDMGEAVKIDDLARNLIKLSGLQPDVDIKIKYTGLRPGEKLYEELLLKEEGITRTENEMIYIGRPIEFAEDRLNKAIVVFQNRQNWNEEETIAMLEELVESFAHKNLMQECL